jgi:hypothetical protein
MTPEKADRFPLHSCKSPRGSPLFHQCAELFPLGVGQIQLVDHRKDSRRSAGRSRSALPPGGAPLTRFLGEER